MMKKLDVTPIIVRGSFSRRHFEYTVSQLLNEATGETPTKNSERTVTQLLNFRGEIGTVNNERYLNL